VNLTDYLDTGLFLDHRILRSMIQAKAEGRRFLNLFGYTGAATVHAAMGGAKTTTMVDLSPVYIDWARSNLALNGFGSKNHKMVRADCMAWLSKARTQYDLIFADPPTFSNTRSLKRVFDVQQEHAELIRLAMRRLAPEGLLIFSTNFRSFKIDLEALSGYDIKDISRMTIPRDFKRRPRIHQCWEVRRKA
jgi:23S rRNA (guanine2445-N2)-methyltransferase / 23S rRNA (guanine2069-N7)-methyltransferase